MSEADLNETQPSHPLGETQPNQKITDTQPSSPGAPEKKKLPGWALIVAAVLIVLIGVLSGTGSGMGQRMDALATQVTGQMAEQYQLGLQAMEAGQYEVARVHFEFIIDNDPNFPGVQAAYTELLLRIQISPTPRATLTPTVSPTPDLRSAEQIFIRANELLALQNWDEAIQNLDSLRKIEPSYRVTEVDGMYYTALRMRGVGKILAGTCQEINLAGGIYDLTQAERFGPLDTDADGLRTYARFYIAGASYWDQDWTQAQYFFNLAMSGYPSLMDSSCMTATERWRFATVKYAEQLLSGGNFCGAEQAFNLAFSVGSPRNEPYYPTATEAYNQCHGSDVVETPTGETPTPSETPSETPETPNP
jgi:tetratricopeptide (TPR) repeat protein